MIKRLLLVTIGLAALVLNPFFGCGEHEPVFHFGADVMRAAVEGTWKLHVDATATEPAIDLVLTISQATARPTTQQSSRGTLVSEAAACSERTLVKSAAACGDTSNMPLEVMLADGTKTNGTFFVHGRDFEWGLLDLDLVRTYAYTPRISPAGVAKVDGYDRWTTLVRVTSAQR